MVNPGVVKVSLCEGKKIKATHPVGAEISIIMDGETTGTQYLTENMTRVNPGVTLKPCHSHLDIEEIVYVINGKGEAWVDGSTRKIRKGDSVLYPPNSKHTVRNTGKSTLTLLCFFSSPQFRKKGAYITHGDSVMGFRRP